MKNGNKMHLRNAVNRDVIMILAPWSCCFDFHFGPAE